jgi:hypothetical protein
MVKSRPLLTEFFMGIVWGYALGASLLLILTALRWL